MKTFLYTLSLIVLFLSGCTSVEKLVRKGKYNKAFSLAVEKIQQKKKVKTKDVKGLETAFRTLNEKDLKHISFLIAEDNPNLWDDVFRTYENIKNRQGILHPLLPLVSNDGYRAQFTMINTNYLLEKHVIAFENSVERMLDHDLDRITDLLNSYDLNDWKKAFKTYRKIKDRQLAIKRYAPFKSEHYTANFELIDVDYLLVDHVSLIESTFKKTMEKDINRITDLINRKNLSSWENAFKIYNKIDKMQSFLKLKMPIESNNGYAAKFDFISNGYILEKHVLEFENAFKSYLSKEMNRAGNLIAKNNPKYWDNILNIYKDIDQTQNGLASHFPILSKTGKKANFKFIKTGELEKQATDNAAEYYYNKAKKDLIIARRGDKNAARNAFFTFAKIKKYFETYKDVDQLTNEAYDLGQTNVLVQIVNRSRKIIPTEFESILLNIDVQRLNKQWEKYNTVSNDKIQYDITANYTIDRVIMTPEREIVEQKIETKEVSDGWEYALDRNGNVMKDTSGNDIKIEKFITLRAEVAKISLDKSLTIEGTFVVIDKQTSVYRKPIRSVARFNEHYCTFRGNKDALTQETIDHLLPMPMNFPSDEELLFVSGDELKKLLSKEIHHYFR